MPKVTAQSVPKTVPRAVKKILEPPVLDIIKRCLQEHWGFEEVTRKTVLTMKHKGKNALRQCVTEKVNLEREVRINLSKEEIRSIEIVDELERLIIGKMLKQKRRKTEEGAQE